MKERSLLSIMASLVILGTGTIPAQAQRTTTNRPNSALVTAIRNAVGSNISNGFDRIEYFFTEVDLNNDGNKEVVVYTAGLHCGTSECPVYIFRRSGNSYLLIGRTGAISNGGQIALLPSRSNGWYDIATFVYNPQQRTANWKLHRFNGKSYQNTFQSLSSKPNQIILRPNRGSGISLADPGIASSQILAQVTQRLTSIRGINLDKVQYIPSENSRDAELNKAIIKWITSTGGNFTNEDFRRLSYYYNRVDLNGDGKPEVLVYLVGGSPSCGTGGCHTLIFKRVGTGYDLVSEIGLTRLPIIVTERRTNGWKDLIILTVGGGARANYWLVRFNGRTYPENSGIGSEVPSNSTVTGRAFMSETRGFSGIALQPQDSQIATGRSPNTGQQTTTGRASTPVQYRDTRALGMAQFLQGKRELLSAQEKLQRAAQGEYTTINVPQSDFLTKPFISVAKTPGAFFGGRDDVSYANYLNLKLKLKAQETVFNEGTSIIKAIEPYNDKLSKDNRYGGRDVSQRIVSKFNDYWRRVEEQNKKPSLSLGSISRALPYALEETRVSNINLIEGGVQTGGKLASAFTDLAGLVKILNLPELTNPESFQRAGRSIDYVFTVKEKLGDIKDAFLKGNNEEVNKINLEIASETIKLIDAQDSMLVRSGEAIAIRGEATKLIERHNFLQQSQLTEVLDGFDKTYLTTAQVSSVVKIFTSTLALIAPGKQAVRTFADKADAVNALLFNALQFSYKEDVRRQYERLKAYSNRNQQMISGLSSSIDFSAQEVGQYLIKTRTDVVIRRPDGTIAVSVNGVVSPP